MPTSAMTLRIFIIDHATGEAGVAEKRADRYSITDTDTRNKLAAACATAALENLTRQD